MAIICWIIAVLMIVQPSLQQQGTYSYSEEINANSSPVCVGGSVIIGCKIVFTDEGGNVTPVSANFRRFEVPVVSGTVNHQLLFDGPTIVIGVMVSHIAPADNNAMYTCTNDAATRDINSTSLMLEVVDIPTVKFMEASDNCKYVNASWTMVDGVCSNVSYNVTLLATDVMPSSAADVLAEDVLERPDLLQSNSYNFTNSAIATSKGSLMLAINAINGPEVGNFSFYKVPQPMMMVENKPKILSGSAEACSGNLDVSWDVMDSINSLCGTVSYNVAVDSTNHSRNVTNTHYSFTDVNASTYYHIAIYGINRAGTGPSLNISVNGRISIIEHSSTKDTVTLKWNAGSDEYCGGVLRYSVALSSGAQNLSNETDTTFTNLRCGMAYTVTITAIYEENGEEVSVSSTVRTGGCRKDDCWPIPCVFIIIACILILILMIDCCCFYYIYKKVKSGSEPHPIVVIIFVILTAGIGWVLYKYLTKTKGPSKIGLQDTEKTPSPVDEPVAYATTETDKVTFGIGGITYADIDIGKGPAAPGSIFPQDKPTYGQVKPSN